MVFKTVFILSVALSCREKRTRALSTEKTMYMAINAERFKKTVIEKIKYCAKVTNSETSIL